MRREGGGGKGVSVSPGLSGLSPEDLASRLLFAGPSVLPSDYSGMENEAVNTLFHGLEHSTLKVYISYAVSNSL